MNILVISNLYPPYYIGGYELRCNDIVDNLIKRGHLTADRHARVTVLTGNYFISGKSDGFDAIEKNNIHRKLHFQDKYPSKVSLKSTIIKELKDNKILKDTIKQTNPDLIYVFNMGGLSKSLLRTIEGYKIPVVYDISDYWLSGEGILDNWLLYWQQSPTLPIARFIKLKMEALITKNFLNRLTKYILPIQSHSFNLNFSYFTSNFLKESYIKSGFNVKNSPVIYCGIPVELIPHKLSRVNNPFSLLYVGSIAPHKGTLAIIKAISILTKKGFQVNLTLIGGMDLDYFKEMNSLVSSENLPVTYKGIYKREEILKTYKDYDTLVFSSVWDEPFSLTLLEGMTAGLAVISTTTGGSSEILKNEENCLTFEPGNANELAKKIELLMNNNNMYEKINSNASKFVKENFTTDKMINKIEDYLKQAITK
ncbi:MAG: glycosyltransferase family 4 protein [bacterium]|nr:glycosyltransferase family 4 protein [bacterium]